MHKAFQQHSVDEQISPREPDHLDGDRQLPANGALRAKVTSSGWLLLADSVEKLGVRQSFLFGA